MTILLFVGIISLAIYLFLSVEVLLGARKIGKLQDIAPAANDECPPVTIIVPALNEAKTVEPALTSILALDYPALEVIAINEQLEDEPEIVNSDPYNEGWFYKLKLSDTSELGALMTAEDYQGQREDE